MTEELEADEVIERLFRFSNNYGITKYKAEKHALSLISNCFTIYERYFTEDEMHKDNVAYYVENKGTWNHSGGNTKHHNYLGMRWAGSRLQMGLNVNLCDSPDIRGTWSPKNMTSEDWSERHSDNKQISIYGDVGQCSYLPAFMNTGWHMDRHDMWVSVFDTSEVVMVCERNVNEFLQTNKTKKGTR
jgi:hypothetical protein